MMSFVVVLPALPVTATIGLAHRSRAEAPSVCRATRYRAPQQYAG